MATYDLDRWSKQIRRRHHSDASLTLHLHPNHCRFEHQNGVFLYDSPIKGLLESIKDARLPVELLDLLDATAVKYYEGCLVVEVVDHRGVIETDGINSGGAAGSGAPGRSVLADVSASGAHSRSNSLASSLEQRNTSRIGTHGSEPNILKPKLSISMSDRSEPSAAFNHRFMVSYKTFEAALREAANLEAAQIKKQLEQQKRLKGKEEVDERKQRQQAPDGTAKPDGQEANQANQLVLQKDIHSAVAAAVASAASMDVPTEQVNGRKDEDAVDASRPMSYRITLGPDIETVWTDLCALREEKRARWTEEDMLAMESRILVGQGLTEYA